MSAAPLVIRAASSADIPAIEVLIARSAHTLSAGDYSREVIDGALGGAFGVDTQLLRDGTYFRGFRRFELVATLPGERLYAARGYASGAHIHWALTNGLSIEFVPMSKTAVP